MVFFVLVLVGDCCLSRKGRESMVSGDGSEQDDIFGGEAICPPEHFGIVESGVYRSNVPHADNFTFIKLLKLKSVILLSAEVPTRVVSTFFEENSVVVRHLGLKTWRPEVSWKPMSEELVKEALEFVLDVRNHPIVICDTTGEDDCCRTTCTLPVSF